MKLVQQGQRRPDIGIGKGIKEVQSTFGRLYEIDADELSEAFDKLFDNDESFSIGNIDGKVMHLPGHTPDHVGYLIAGNVFTGDSIFNPDVGSARCDFPGGSASQLYHSIRTLLSLPPHFRLYTGHDYPPSTREADKAGHKYKPYTTVEEQNKENKHMKAGVSEEEFVKWRTERDETLSEPQLIHQALQVNIRGGQLPRESGGGYRFLHVPLKIP